jgi:hypothetical protein
MRKCVFAVAAALALLCAPIAAPAAAPGARPPSVARWLAHWNAHSDAVFDRTERACEPFVATGDDLRTGACVAAGLLQAYPELLARFDRELSRLAALQPPACRSALLAYKRAADRTMTAFAGYLRVHRHVAIAELNRAAAAEPFATLAHRKNLARSRALRVCAPQA